MEKQTESQEAETEKKPLDIKPKPPVGKRLNKRLMGIGILAVGCVMGTVVYGITKRADANSAAAQSSAGTPAAETVQAIPKTEAKTLISNLQKPVTASVANPATQPTQPGQTQPGETPGQTPPPGGPSSLTTPPWRPVSAMQDPSFQNFYQQPPQAQAQQQAKPETQAQEAARLEHEALYAPLANKKQEAVKTPIAASAGNGLAGFETTPGQSGASDIEQIASLAKSLIPSSLGGANIAPDASRVSGNKSAATFADSARKHSEDDSLATLRTGPLSPFEIKAGWDIPATLEYDLKSELPGELRAMVTQNVFDTATGRHILIPQGSRVIGTYNEKTAFGQSGVEVIWTRLIFPDSSSLDLDGMIGQDVRGEAGLRGKTDNHWGQLLSTALLTSALSATASLANNRSGSGIGYYPSAVTAAGSGAAQSIQETGSQLTQRNLSRRPTVLIPAGTGFNVHVNKDIRFEGTYVSRPALLPGG